MMNYSNSNRDNLHQQQQSQKLLHVNRNMAMAMDAKLDIPQEPGNEFGSDIHSIDGGTVASIASQFTDYNVISDSLVGSPSRDINSEEINMGGSGTSGGSSLDPVSPREAIRDPEPMQTMDIDLDSFSHPVGGGAEDPISCSNFDQPSTNPVTSNHRSGNGMTYMSIDDAVNKMNMKNISRTMNLNIDSNTNLGTDMDKDSTTTNTNPNASNHALINVNADVGQRQHVCTNGASGPPPSSTPFDPFRRLILDHVQAIVTKPPSRDSLYQLIKVTHPNATMKDIQSMSMTKQGIPNVNENGNKNEKNNLQMFTILKSHLHPHHHPQDIERATSIFDVVDVFYNQCLAILRTQDQKEMEMKMKMGKSTTTTIPNLIQQDQIKGHGQIKESTLSSSLGNNNNNSNGIALYPQSTTLPNGHGAEQDPKSRKVSTSSSPIPIPTKIPSEFHVQDKWSFLPCLYSGFSATEDSYEDSAKSTPTPNSSVLYQLDESTITSSQYAAIVCYQCINARGAIAHGAQTELVYGTISETARASSAEHALLSLGGYRVIQGRSASASTSTGEADTNAGKENSADSSINTTWAIKKELMNGGPIVSTSFLLTEESAKTSTSFLKHHGTCSSGLSMEHKCWYLSQLMNQLIIFRLLLLTADVYVAASSVVESSSISKEDVPCPTPAPRQE